MDDTPGMDIRPALVTRMDDYVLALPTPYKLVSDKTGRPTSHWASFGRRPLRRLIHDGRLTV